jgi:integrase
MAQAKAAAGDRYVAVHGAYTAQRALEAGVLDELQIHQVPVLFGVGRRQFEVLPSRVELEIVRVIDTPGATIRRGHVTVNPTSNLDMPACNSRRIVQVSRKKVETFLAALPDNLRPLYATAVYAGLRRGELRGLKWEDVDLANGVIHVRRGWDDKDGEIAPKSAKALRDVPLFGILRDYVDEHKLRTGGSGSDFVFASKRGNPFTPSNVRKQAAKACREAGVKCFGLHELRHVFVSFCVDMGFDLAEIGDYVGHSTVYMIDRYRHLLEGKRQAARERADAYFASTGTIPGTKEAETLS